MSDANKQSVERCKYRHEWRKVETEPTTYVCDKCSFTPSRDSKLYHEAESILHLRSILKPGDTVYTVLRHVSRSGMSRNIDLYYIDDNKPIWISAYVGHAIGSPQSRRNWERSQGLTVGGCGMDMGFHLVYSLGRVLWPEGFGEPATNGVSVNGNRRIEWKGVRPESPEQAERMRENFACFFGRNGDTSGWDKDGGYALNHQWI